MKLSDLYENTAMPAFLDEIILDNSHHESNGVQTIDENRKWVSGRFDRNLGIDKPTHLHGDGETHAHVFGRHGNELGVVNFNGTGSHGSKFKLHPKDADALRAIGCKVSPDNIVEWMKLCLMPNVIYG